ncbi:ComF family protein [Clostridium sp. CX1]|uniref:ComF family protein n=1 Tax=Clostridium sp. CX1 TaxID=2978346 RepID=UPI0021BFB243|nr:ComF family protein [Clostridium sp. CX1]MCT8975826.1 ComF family protein [Clostridium sp. CX1]
MGNGIVKNLRFLWDCVLQVIYSTDENCVLCGQDLFGEGFMCNDCEERIRFCEDAFQVERHGTSFNCYSISYYSGGMMELVLMLKYKSNFRAGETIANYMIKRIEKEEIEFDAVTYIPMSKKSLKKRGYNQSKYLAKTIGDALNKPLVSYLCKIKDTKDQIGLSGNERWNNVQESFDVIDKINVKNKNILLVDDVITTGATAFSCAYQLMKKGAKKITILTAAKSKV